MPDAIPMMGLLSSLEHPGNADISIVIYKEALAEYLKTHDWDVVETDSTFRFNFYKVPKS